MKIKPLLLTLSLAFATLAIAPPVAPAATIALDWPDNPPLQSIMNYDVLCSTNNELNYQVIATVPTSDYSGSFASGARYFFRTRGRNLAGISFASVTTSTPTAPTETTNVTHVINGGDDVTISWSLNPPGQLVSSYYILIASNATTSSFFPLGSVDGATSSFTHSNLNHGFVYAFRVQPENFAGLGPVSDSTVTTGIPSPPGQASITITP